MRGVYVLCLMAACSGSHPQLGGDGGIGGDTGVADGAVNDASVDAPIDAPVDAPPDAAPCPSVEDRDGDGICDAVDDCPDIADPGQADLDGDGLGWMCDPIESVTLDAVNDLEQAALHDDTFAARTKTDCPAYNMCSHELLQVSAAGKMVVRSDSTSTVDAWQAEPAVEWMGGPFITAQDRVLWSRGYEMGDTGDFDLATRQFTSRAAGVFSISTPNYFSVLASDGAMLAASLETASQVANFDEIHADGSLSPIAMAQSFGFEKPAITVPGPVPRALVPVRENFTTALRLYTQGVGLTEIMSDTTPMTNLGDIETVLVARHGRRLVLWPIDRRARTDELVRVFEPGRGLPHRPCYGCRHARLGRVFGFPESDGTWHA